MGVRDAHPEKVRIGALELFKVSWQEADDLQQKLFSKFYACMIGRGGDASELASDRTAGRALCDKWLADSS
ncbi:hypothetical protein AO263_13190 [Pseudomonas sp. NZIPFR-PS5]|uniref:Uncharacterized protein n=1 Tax=Pseudomonas graminis TaxID=158627 RepID=A0A1C2EEJ8_9PSED|nr:hypothetical protein BBI10_02400 [Pseudomonas graminis]PHX39972.1 hypothetical protein AO263_13190 [Pseudomonas sp. NZIPFR-PS5]